ncbi:MAG: VOC family protein [Niastella sp.]|nr:VOC family protein [Niastella sp.]
MITKMSHTTLFVQDQEKAYDFYVNKLGFKVHTDVMMGNTACEDGQEEPKDAEHGGGGYRWLTLNPPDQPDLEIILMPVVGLDEDALKAINLLLERGVMGAGVFHTPDCRATYEELKAKGVVFKSEPKEQFYGIECIITDSVGNWFSMTQPKEQ